MSQRNVVIRVLGSFLSRRRRLVTGAISALGVSGLVLGGLAAPASAADLPNNVDLEQWTNVNFNWVTGDLGLSGADASTYTEGDTVPFRLDVTSAGAGTFNFSVCRDYMDGAVRGYLSLAPYTTSYPPSTSPSAVTQCRNCCGARTSRSPTNPTSTNRPRRYAIRGQNQRQRRGSGNHAGRRVSRQAALLPTPQRSRCDKNP